MATAHVTDAECVQALQAVAEHGTHRKAALALGLNNTTISQRVKLAALRGLTADTPVLKSEDKLRLELKKARQDIAALNRENDSAERIRQEIYNLAARDPEPPKWLRSPKSKENHRGMPCTIWSDWHYGERVRPEEVAGYNEFDQDIARARIQVLVDKTIDLCKNHMGKPDVSYPGLVLMLGGDMISGDIHEELMATNDRTPQQCINDLTDIIASAIEQLADEFGRVFVPCVVGNHGRSTRKPRMKGRVYTSHEWNIYCSLERYFKRDIRVTFLIPNESDAYFTVYGHRYLLTHGDSLGVKGGDGIIGAIGPIMRGTMKIGRSESQVGRDVDTVVMGHWHQPLWLPSVIVNGALKGYDEYARLAMRAPYEPPSQQLWFTHPVWGITARWTVLLEKHRKAPQNTKILTWQETSAN